jgi:hypothetical protein
VSDLACALNVHSVHSDGGGTIPEIAAAATDAGIDVVVVTDHDTLAGRGEEGWYGDTLVLIGIELSPKGRDHHGMDAVSVWNVATEGVEGSGSPLAAARFARDPLDEFPAPNPAALDAWDRLGARRRVVGIAGLDEHQGGARVGTHVVPRLRYEVLFRRVRTHVVATGSLTGELEFDRALVYDALRAGRCYMAIDTLAPASGFHFRARQGSAELPMGGEAGAGGWTIAADLPLPASLTLRCDGRIVARAEDDVVELATDEAGVFRVEARLGPLVWLLSNPIYLRPE